MAGARAPVLRVRPNIDTVVTDAGAISPHEGAFLERIAAARSQDLDRLSQDRLPPGLRGVVQLAETAGRSALLLPEAQEKAVRRQRRKLGYVPRKG